MTLPFATQSYFYIVWTIGAALAVMRMPEVALPEVVLAVHICFANDGGQLGGCKLTAFERPCSSCAHEVAGVWPHRKPRAIIHLSARLPLPVSCNRMCAIGRILLANMFIASESVTVIMMC